MVGPRRILFRSNFLTTLGEAGGSAFKADFRVSGTDTQNRHGDRKVAFQTTAKSQTMTASDEPMKKMRRKILVMGLPGAGKTTFATTLAPLLNAVVFNADAVRSN